MSLDEDTIIVLREFLGEKSTGSFVLNRIDNPENRVIQRYEDSKVEEILIRAVDQGLLDYAQAGPRTSDLAWSQIRPSLRGLIMIEEWPGQIKHYADGAFNDETLWGTYGIKYLQELKEIENNNPLNSRWIAGYTLSDNFDKRLKARIISQYFVQDNLIVGDIGDLDSLAHFYLTEKAFHILALD